MQMGESITNLDHLPFMDKVSGYHGFPATSTHVDFGVIT